MSDIMVTMSMTRYKSMESNAEKLQSVKKLARDILVEHTECKDDWSKSSDMTESMTLEESQLLLKRILE